MTGTEKLTQAAQHEFARRHVDGEASLAKVQAMGVRRVTQVLSDLGDIGRRLYVAGKPGPDQERRRAGIDRLNRIMRG